jgi:UDP-N-acetylmuramoyl-tripeptide--D-alanyl-D-alanine ligase
MGMMTLQQAYGLIQPRITQATLVGDGAEVLQRVHTDTRSLQPGDLFVALRGERFDAHDFLPQARAQGAAAALAQAGLLAAGLPGIEVPDTTEALGALAAGWRAQFQLPLIAVTGSNGKTTVTQMLATILHVHAGDAALATRGNLNNAIGVPQTLLRLEAHHRIAVVELGMNHPGEIHALANMAQPTVALVNNAQREHLEFMHTVEAVAHENGAVLAALPAHGVAVFPSDDDYTPVWQTLAGSRQVMTFSDTDPDATVRATAQWKNLAWDLRIETPVGAASVHLQLAGRHNVRNALAACACALAAGVPLAAVVAGLNAFVPVQGRSRAFAVRHADHAITVVDDSYNANPDSVRAAIDVLAALPGPQLLVLGDMAEVGEQGPQFHAEAGAYARSVGISHLYAVGDLAVHACAAFGLQAVHFANMPSLQTAVLHALPDVASVLVKGSRFMRMEQVVQTIAGKEQEGQHAAH